MRSRATRADPFAWAEGEESARIRAESEVTPMKTATARTLSDLFEASASRQDSRAANAIASLLRGLIADCLFLPARARSYREDCLQELTFGLYDLLRRWHADGKLSELRSVQAFARHYVRWHAPAAMSRLSFRLSSPATPQYPMGEQELSDGMNLREMPLLRTESGCHQAVAVARMRDTPTERIDHEMDRATLSRVDRRALELAENGEGGRRRIEMCLVAEFEMSHRQARRALDGLLTRLRR
ncbi:hypothetical protein HN371_05590 [Candidatus Poribacteria bacterium]|nr:hypothetical protein [Candidatus Poribacteria bacterium]MBT5531947.1 hypothetical protein [Candidatus Poribacteria bacterium]MBT5711467.1 hypothetical protein [Candidatus Poribacteria bacterium]MBT7100927.1 hypothetical protein [Candidatus Poribacteria bacterium]MBT7805374.1 hypothetical protein [Candidatus Poribacteria bacterium]